MTSIRDLLLVHHTHTDIGYTHYQDNVFALHREYIRRAIRLAEKYSAGPPGERFKWTCESTLTVDDFLQHATTAEIDRLRVAHRAGLIDFSGMYCNWSPLVTVDLLAESLLVADRLRHDYGFDVSYGLNCDVNGQSWGLVELLLDSGFRGFAMAINRVMARDPQPRPIGFWWAGPSGRKLLVWHGEHYGFAHRLGLPRVQTPEGWRYDPAAARPLLQRYLAALNVRGYPYDFAQLQVTSTFQWDNGGPHEELVRFVRDWNARGWQPRLSLVGLSDLFERLQAQPGLETRAGDWTDWWAHGAASTAFETALHRRSLGRFSAARQLGAFLRSQPEMPVYPTATADHAWRGLALYAEHTWGGFDSISHADSPNARGQWHRKATYAYAAAAAVTRLVQSFHSDLSARLPQPAEPSVCIFNPLPWARREPIFLPSIAPSGWEAANLEYQLELSGPQAAAAARIDYGVHALPPCGYLTLPLRPEPPVPLPEFNTGEPTALMRDPLVAPHPAPGLVPTRAVHVHAWTIENHLYRVRLDPTSGAIVSLTTTADGREWVDTTTPWRLGHYIYETNASPRGRLDMQLEYDQPYRRPDSDRQPDLAPVRRGPTRVLSVDALAGVGHSRLSLRLDAPGAAAICLQVVLYDDLPWIDLIYDMDKLPAVEPESIYIAFPLALIDPVSRYETAGAIVEAEGQQIVNSARDFYPIQHWVDVTDAHRGVTIASPDAYMLHLGGFTNHRYLPAMQRGQPLVVGWPINNHWFTNFKLSQSGWLRFRYRLLPHAAPFDPVQATRFGAETAIEPLYGPVWDRPAGLEDRVSASAPHLPDRASFLTIEPANVHLVGMKPAADGKGVIIHLQELAGSSSDFRLDFPLGNVASASVVSLLERPLDIPLLQVTPTQVTGCIEARRVQTLRISYATP